MFSFREWKDGDNLEYCGATIEKGSDGTLKLNHTSYLRKVKPLTLGKHLGPEAELSSQEATDLRGLLGALQWPAVQSSPHLQASTSIYSGSVSRGLVKTALEANRLLKFAKENSDVGLTYVPLDLGDMRIVTAFDASFGCRPDGSSQGGFLVMLAPKKILETEEDFYHILDWRSLKLPRIARSSLAAEAQAAACASDATEFACRYFEHLRSPTVPLGELLKLRSSLDPVLITDAKALFDSYHRESLVWFLLSLTEGSVWRSVWSKSKWNPDGCLQNDNWPTALRKTLLDSSLQIVFDMRRSSSSLTRPTLLRRKSPWLNVFKAKVKDRSHERRRELQGPRCWTPSRRRMRRPLTRSRTLSPRRLRKRPRSYRMMR